ncbi:MAG: SWIM zinc finger family protein, partial [Candidatus Woesearchaeota archaeon]
MAEKLDKNILKMCKSVLNKSDSGSYAKGKDYYKEGCVSSVSFDGDTIEAYCEGNSDYYMTIDCFNGSTNCSCPSPYNPCKHVVALCLWLQQNKPLDTKNIKSILENMPKSEILDMIIKDKQILDKFSFALQIESAETIQGLVNTIRYDPNN